MINQFKVIFIFLLILSCRQKQSVNFGNVEKNSAYEHDRISKRINLNNIGDTSMVEFENAGYLFKMYYSQNKPQYIVVKSKPLVERIKMNHYANDNSGLYLTLYDSIWVKAFGYKYIDGHKGIDIIMDSSSSKIKFLSNWKEYTNDGEKYDFSEIEQGKLKVYQYKDGEIVDSFFMKRGK